MKYRPICLLMVLCAFSLNSCKDDPALVKQREEQKAEIARLEGEMNILSEKINALPADRSDELADTKKKVELQNEEMAKLEKDITTLQAKKRGLEDEFGQYQRKYPVNR